MNRRHDVYRNAACMIVTLLALAGATITLSACNTTAGAGKDVSAAGQAVTNTADKVKNGL
jgi:predicted small secreted protein